MSLDIYVNDVGHGQAVHIITPDGKIVVIDLGTSSGFSPLEVLRHFYTTIDKLIITHPHGDHISDILNLERLQFKIRQIWRPVWLPPEEILSQNQSTYRKHLEAYLRLSDRYSMPIPPADLVGNPAATGGVSIEEFASSNCGTNNINNHSGVVVIRYLGVTVIVPGDNEPPSWRSLLTQTRFVEAVNQADVFMASHHGRRSGHFADVLKSTRLKLCIVSDGPCQDSDLTANYSDCPSGWFFHSRSDGSVKKRYCVTTRCDGMIHIQIGNNPQRAYLQITGR